MTVRELGVPGLIGSVLAAILLAFLAAYVPFAALGGVATLILVAWIMTRAELLLFVLVAAVPWEGMLDFPSENLSVVKLLGAGLVIAFFFRTIARSESLRFSPVLGAGLAFGVFVALSLMASADPAIGATKTLRYVFFLIFLFLVSQLVDSRETAYKLVRVLVLSAAVASLYGLVQFLSGTVERASGPLVDPNDFAYVMATTLPLAALLLMEDRQNRWIWIASLALLLAATLATLSRGALVGLGALLVWAIASRRIGVGGVIAAGLAVITVLALAFTFWGPLIDERIDTKGKINQRNADSRLAFWSAAGRMWLEHPLLGIGPERFSTEADEYLRNNPLVLPNPVVHNSYLEILAENGIFALAAFLTMVVLSWLSLTRAEREARSVGDRSLARLAAAIKGILVISIVSGMFLSEQLQIPFWLVCGLAASGAFAAASAPTRTRARAPAIALR